MRINIALASDENFWIGLKTTIYSVQKYASRDDELHFYVMCNGILEEQKADLSQCIQKRKGKITFLKSFAMACSSLPNCSAGSQVAYYRYFLPELLPDLQKILYLDSDLLVLSSLAELFNTNLENNYIAGASDIGYNIYRILDAKKYFIKGRYINSGVLLMNLSLMRRDGLSKKFYDTTIEYKDKLVYSDQDIINMVCNGKIKLISYKWNVKNILTHESSYIKRYCQIYSKHKQDIITAIDKPSIIHYITFEKPWNSYACNLADKWHSIYLETLDNQSNDKLAQAIANFRKYKLFYTSMRNLHIFLNRAKEYFNALVNFFAKQK